MKLNYLLAGRPDFASKLEIIEFIKHSKNFDSSRESPDHADALLIFATSKQHTWLVSSAYRLYCILDDLRNDEPHINWSLPRSRLIANSGVSARVVTIDKSEFSGLVSIEGVKRDWLFTKRLFADEPIEEKIRKLIAETMLTRTNAGDT